MSQKYADIIIDISHEAIDRVFQYSIPEAMEENIHIGMVVEVPFGNGNRIRHGYVVGFADEPSYDKSRIKSIAGPADKVVSVESNLINLAAFIRDRYGCTMAAALKTVMPVKKRIRPVTEKWVSLNLSEDKAKALLEEYMRRHYSAKTRIIDTLLRKKTMTLKELSSDCRVTSKQVLSMADAGILSIAENNVYRNGKEIEPADISGIKLNRAQKDAVENVCSKMDKNTAEVILLNGVTGSGKTEVYVRAIRHAINIGRQTILLVPEINLTFQLVRYLRSYFGDRVAVMNSRMSDGEKYDIIRKIENNDADIVVGPRSALFVPMSRLGLIIIDEEHDASYINDNTPRYHAVEVAQERCRLENACLLLGSATPSLTSYNNAVNGHYQLLSLPDRVSDTGMAQSVVVDMREELRMGNRSMFSYELMTGIKNALDKHQQIMLFINKRGYNSSVSCRSCGKVIKCPHCDVALKKHSDNRLMCHYCGYITVVPSNCYHCGSGLIGGYGAGTEKVEDQVKKLFPQARVLRMDKDTTRLKNSGLDILEEFARKDADILIGTQMIVKGYDFPDVTLVGIMLADLTLFNNDYMAGERTFDLITQAAGRAGRGSEPGKVIIQTYQPDNYVIQAAAAQDYEGFFMKEMAYRKLMDYPPASNLLVMLLTSKDEEELINKTELLGTDIKRILKGKKAVSVIGPAEPVINKLNDVYRRVIYFKSGEYNNLLFVMKLLDDSVKRNQVLFENIRVQYDFNPTNMY